MSAEPSEQAKALSRAVKAALLPHLGDYKEAGVVKAKAYWPVPMSTALTAEGLNPAWKVGDKLEAVFALFPGADFTPRHETGDTGVSGIVHHELVLKAWGGSTFPAYEALVEAFPLLTTNFARRPRPSPAGNGRLEMLTVFIPVEW